MITKINFSSQQSFTAKLYDTKGNRIKNFELIDDLEGKDTMSKRGSLETEIHVNDFISKQNHYGDYDNSAKITVKNPLFGTQDFVQDLHHKTNLPIKGESIYEFYHMDLLTGLRSNDCKDLENRALRAAIIDELKKSKICNPMEVFECMLAKSNNHGFNETRVSEFKTIATDLLNEIFQNGLKMVKK